MANQASDNNQYPVYVGIWTNWSRGQILGVTLTITREYANVLIAITAFFIAFVSTRFWRILCFAFHRHYATADSRDVVHHQTQAILRNSSSPESGIQLLFRLTWTNRNKQSRFSPLLVLVVAAISIAAFTAAGSLSSQIASAIGTEVLIKSHNCGYVNATIMADAGNWFKIESPVLAAKANNAANYAQQCYSTNTSGTLDCGRFVTKKLNDIVDVNAPCPFDESLCRSRLGNLRIDSGLINSHEHLGLNAPPKDRILGRFVLHCAPLVTEGYSSQINTSVGTVTAYHYGNLSSPDGNTAYTWIAESIESQYALVLAPDTLSPFSNYMLSTIYIWTVNGQFDLDKSDFRPIEALYRNDADITMVYLSGGGVIFSAPSTDQWYQVSPKEIRVETKGANSPGAYSIYLPREPASPLGCATQFQFCYADVGNCGPLSSLSDAVAGAAALFNGTLDDVKPDSGPAEDIAALQYFVAAIGGPANLAPLAAVDRLGPASLTSQSTLLSNTQASLEPNQWQLDVKHWFDIYMATWQADFLELAYISPNASLPLETRSAFKAATARKLCNNQKIRSTEYTSFSIFGLLFTFVTGSLIVLVSYILEPVSYFLYRKWDFKKYAHLEWTALNTLQMQRLAQEELGYGNWSSGTEEIPTAEADDQLGCLDISNPDHPVLKPPVEGGNSSEDEQPVQAEVEEPEEPEHYDLDSLLGSESVRSESRNSGVPVNDPRFSNSVHPTVTSDQHPLGTLLITEDVYNRTSLNSAPEHNSQDN
ncbi:hypothetical protein F4777DRAFT_457313 [Nemania sp. FL0916]|nr:hypothetical protein F4777DRAFT_457313 [Nemania sp. FL0916]